MVFLDGFLLKRAVALSMLAAIERLIPACAVTPTTSVISGSPTPLSGDVIDLIISEQRFLLDGHPAPAMTFNGSIPGPVVRLKEGQQATLRVRNRLEESTSIHWHGILLPHDMDDSARRVLLYTDLHSLAPYPDQRAPERQIELHLTGHMNRFIWSFDGKKFSEAEPIRFQYGERLRLTFVNDTMMEHPLHLHGTWMYLENGAGDYLPRKHTVIVKPAERLSVAITAHAPGPWAFHCHLLLHMEAGMFRVVEVVA